jgi:polysaccharide biosynthesis transport protein
MLQQQHPPSIQSTDSAVEAGFSETLQFVLAFLSRQYAVIGFVAAIVIAMGFVYLFTTPPSYTATASMLIDTSNIRQVQQQSMDFDSSIDSGTVESQVEILKSDSIALAVIKKLDLVEDREFVGPGGGLVGTVLSSVMGLFASSNGTSSDFATEHAALGAFQSGLNVGRVGLSYIIAISFRSLSPDRAAQIANAIADAYIDDQLEAKYQTTRRAGAWLQARLEELRAQASIAQRAVVEFKNKHNMIDAGGRTINEQQLAELNSELVMAKEHTAEARARDDRVQSVLTSNSPEAVVSATVSDTLNNPVISNLREQYLTLSARYEDWVPRYGANHLAVVNVHNQMAEIQNSIRNELQRIAETYKSDFEIAKQREDSVQNQLNQAVSQSQVTNQAQVALRELESNAESYQALYDNFLQRYMESVQQESFPITDARVISAASPPLGPSHPKAPRVLGIATVAGLVFGVLAGAWRELADRVFRTQDQVEAILQADCIALVPKVKELPQTGEVIRHGSEGQIESVQSVDACTQKIALATGIYATIMESPFSAFAEAIRSVKVAIDLSPITQRQVSRSRKPTKQSCKVIGFTSSIPNEGKSSIAGAVARLAAHAGARTLLVDCDLKNPSLSRSLSPLAYVGLLEVLKGELAPESAIWVDPATNMKFLPVVMKSRLANSSEILSSEQTRAFFDSLRDTYDYIFMDLAPLMPIVDVRASPRLVDSYVYVVEWGKTRVDFVEQALGSARGVYEHLLGVVLNKVDLRSLGRYDGRGDSYYKHGHYHRYGYAE